MCPSGRKANKDVDSDGCNSQIGWENSPYSPLIVDETKLPLRDRHRAPGSRCAMTILLPSLKAKRRGHKGSLEAKKTSSMCDAIVVVGAAGISWKWKNGELMVAHCRVRRLETVGHDVGV